MRMGLRDDKYDMSVSLLLERWTCKKGIPRVMI